MLFQVPDTDSRRCEILHDTAPLDLKVLCGVTCHWLNLKFPPRGPFSGELCGLEQVSVCGEVFLYLFLPGSLKPLANGFLSIFSFVIWPRERRGRGGGVRVDVSSPRRWANNELSFYSRAERSRRELHLPAAPRAISHVKQGSWRSCSFIWCLNGLRTPAVGPVTGHYWVSVIIRLLLVKGAPMKRAGSGREWLGYCWNGSQSWGQLPPSDRTGMHRPALNNLITQKFIIFLDMMFRVHSF